MPKIDFRCNAKASYFAYPPPLEDKKKVETEKVEVAVLSTTNKKKGGSERKKKEQGLIFGLLNNIFVFKEVEKMEIDEAKDDILSDQKTDEKYYFYLGTCLV